MPSPPSSLPQMCVTEARGAGVALGQCVGWGRWEQHRGDAQGRGVGEGPCFGMQHPCSAGTRCVHSPQQCMLLHRSSAGVLRHGLVPAYIQCSPTLPSGWDGSRAAFPSHPTKGRGSRALFY